jgi:N-acylglucosamine 2-epimerase
MVLISTAQELRAHVPDPSCDKAIADAFADIEQNFCQEHLHALVSYVDEQGRPAGPDGSFSLSPGHAIESAWFMLRELQLTGDTPHIKELARRIMNWTWDWGGAEDYGGMYHNLLVRPDGRVEGRDRLKPLWPNSETLIAMLLAYQATRDPKYLERHRRLLEWMDAHYRDREYGEWFGWVHRDGRLAHTAKGGNAKCTFHHGRALLFGWNLLKAMTQQGPQT